MGRLFLHQYPSMLSCIIQTAPLTKKKKYVREYNWKQLRYVYIEIDEEIDYTICCIYCDKNCGNAGDKKKREKEYCKKKKAKDRRGWWHPKHKIK